MRFGFIHDEFGFSWRMAEAYPYVDSRAYHGDTESIHGTIHHLPKALQCDKVPFRPDFDYSPYDCLIFFLQGGRCQTDIDYMKAIKSKYPDILLIWWWGELYRFDQNIDLWFEHILKSEGELVKVVDLMTCSFHKYSEEFASVIKRRFNKEYRLLCEPYDTEHILKNHRKYHRDFDKGIWTMRHGRNIDISRSLTVMGRLQKKYPKLPCYVHLYHSFNDEQARKDVYSQQHEFAPHLKFEFSPILEPHDAFMDYVKELFFVIDDYFAYSGSNLSCATACMGTPTIGNDYNTSNYLCFPKLNFGLNDIDKWVEAGERLIKDETYYWEVSRKSQEMAKKYYSFDVVRNQVEKIYNEFSKN